MIVLDTHILSELMRSAPEAAVERWLADQPEASVFISASTEAEPRYGAAIMPKVMVSPQVAREPAVRLYPTPGDRVLRAGAFEKFRAC